MCVDFVWLFVCFLHGAYFPFRYFRGLTVNEGLLENLETKAKWYLNVNVTVRDKHGLTYTCRR